MLRYAAVTAVAAILMYSPIPTAAAAATWQSGSCSSTQATNGANEAVNGIHPAAIDSLQADSGPPDGHGFQVNYSQPPLKEVQRGPAATLAKPCRISSSQQGFRRLPTSAQMACTGARTSLA